MWQQASRKHYLPGYPWPSAIAATITNNDDSPNSSIDDDVSGDASVVEKAFERWEGNRSLTEQLWC